MRRSTVVAVVAAAAALLAAVVVGALSLRPDGPASDGASGEATREPTGAALPSLNDPSPATRRPCSDATEPFDPRRIDVPGVVAGAAVVTPPRDADDVPGVPPLTARGKTVFAWDREQGIRPGDARGNVLLNAHTWPDGSALGNRLLDGLRRGDRIVVAGSGVRLCYRVTERLEVLASEGLPRYYATDGPPQLAIVVCSGRRLGPGVWEKRTVWFASPVRQG